MKPINYDLLNKKLDTFVYQDYPVFEDDILFEERLCNIILACKLPVEFDTKTKEELYKTKTNLSYNELISLSIEFLNIINPSYAIKLEKLISRELINFKRTDDLDEKSYIDISTGEFKVVLLQTVEDALSLLHEFMHYINSRCELANATTSYYTECFSNFIEFVLIDYICKYHPKYKKDSIKMKHNIFISLYEYNIVTKIIIELVKKKINGKTINSYEMLDIVKKLNDEGISVELIDTALTQLLDDVMDEDECSFEDCYIIYIRNTVALLISCYMHNLLSDKTKLNEVLELSDNLNKFDIKQVLLYLNLDFKDTKEFDLTEESYKKLEYSYRNSLKKLW